MSFTFYTPFPVDHTQVPNTNQLSFPVLVIGNDSRFKTIGNGGHVSNGNDIRPFSDTGATSAYTYELISYNATTGIFAMFVNIPILSHTVTTNIYIFYGDSSITTDGSSSATWDSNFKAVYHFGDGVTLNLNDSTSNGVNGTNNGVTAVAGPFLGAAAATSTQDVSLGTPSAIQDLAIGSYTLSFWTKAANPSIIMGRDDNNSSEGWYVAVDNSNGLLAGNVLSGTNARYVSSALLSTTVFSKWDITVVGGASAPHTIAMFHNGASDTPVSITSGAGSSNSDAAQVARLFNSTYAEKTRGSLTLAEVRISNIIRSSDWLATEYNNQNSPSTFTVMGTEVPFGGGAIIVIPPHLFGHNMR